MSFLRLNSLVVPVLSGTFVKDYEEIGSRGRAFSGQMRSTRRALKRRWSGVTRRLTQAEACVLQSVILGLGESWPYDYRDTERLVEDFFSSKGLGTGPSTGAMLTPGTAGDDSGQVLNNQGIAESQYGSGALASCLGFTNLIPTSSLSLSELNGATVVTDANNFVIGTDGSSGDTGFKVDTPGSVASEGVQTDPVSASSSTAYTGVVYVKFTDNPEVTVIVLRLVDDVGLITEISLDSAGAVTGQWVKFVVEGTTDGAATTIHLEVVTDGADATTFYVDCFQIAAGAAASGAEIFGDPTVENGDLTYDPSFLNDADAVSINTWVRADAAAPPAARQIAIASKAVGNFGICLERIASGSVQYRTEGEDGSLDSIFAGGVFDGDWHMITTVMRLNPVGSEPKKELYVDGVKIADSSPSSLPDPKLFTIFDVGHRASTLQWWRDQRGLIDDFVTLPYAASANQISGWFSLGRAFSALPALVADGDFIKGSEVVVEGELGTQSYDEFIDAGVNQNAAQSVAFILHEV